MRLGWYINRLRGMTPAEMLHRGREVARRRGSRQRDEGWAHYPAPALHPVLPMLAERVRAAGPAQRAAIRAAAAQTLEGKFAALGREWPQRDSADLFPAELWRFDPVSGGLWPGADTYAFDIDFRHDGTRGDIKYVWEINRLQFLPGLAAEFLLDGDAPARVAIEAAIASWHAANQPFRGVGWASGIEVALRAISLIVTLALVGAQLRPETRRQAGEILAASRYWLPRFPSKFSSANNHLMAELAGEYLLGLALGAPSPGAQRALAAEVEKQILADGVGAEQSPTYAAFTAELVLLCALAARATAEPFPASVTSRLLAFADFVAWLGPQTVGDDDEGRVLTLGEEADYPRSVASAIAGQFGAAGMAPAAGDFRSLVFGAPPAAAATPVGLRSFAEGGLSIFHGTIGGHAVALGFDHGPLGYLAIAAHGHADALALTLSLDGRSVLVDPGTYLYGSGKGWRDWFRSTPAHNTVNIAGASQSVMTGAFNWGAKAVTQLAEVRPAPTWSLRAAHDGYRRRFGVVHQRTVAADGAAITVTDQFIGTAQPAEIVFQLAPGLACTVAGRTATIADATGVLLNIVFHDAGISLAAGGDAIGEGGWVAPRFGHKVPAFRLAWRGEIGAAGVTTRLVPGP